MKDSRSNRATVRFHGTTSLASTFSASEAVMNEAAHAYLSARYSSMGHPALCNGYDANTAVCVVDMRFAAHPRLTLNSILKRDHCEMLVAARNGYGGTAPTDICGGGPDVPTR